MICYCRFIDFNRIYAKLVSRQGTKIKHWRIDDPREDRIHGIHRGRPGQFGRSRSFPARRTNGGAALYNFVYKSKWKLDLLVLLCSVGFARPPLKTRGSRMPVKKKKSKQRIRMQIDGWSNETADIRFSLQNSPSLPFFSLRGSTSFHYSISVRLISFLDFSFDKNKE